MSDAEEIKAGHPPATKVGNMRVPGNNRSRNSSSGGGDKPSAGSNEEDQPKQTGAAEGEADGGAVQAAPKQGQVVAGAVISDAKAFPPAAVKAFHEKPQPTHEKSHTI